MKDQINSATIRNKNSIKCGYKVYNGLLGTVIDTTASAKFNKGTENKDLGSRNTSKRIYLQKSGSPKLSNECFKVHLDKKHNLCDKNKESQKRKFEQSTFFVENNLRINLQNEKFDERNNIKKKNNAITKNDSNTEDVNNVNTENNIQGISKDKLECVNFKTEHDYNNANKVLEEENKIHRDIKKDQPNNDFMTNLNFQSNEVKKVNIDDDNQNNDKNSEDVEDIEYKKAEVHIKALDNNKHTDDNNVKHVDRASDDNKNLEYEIATEEEKLENSERAVEYNKQKDDDQSTKEDNALVNKEMLRNKRDTEIDKEKNNDKYDNLPEDNAKKETHKNFEKNNSIKNDKFEERDQDQNNKSMLHMKIIKPKGFLNSSGYCFFNSVIQVLRSCIEFNENIISYHQSKVIAASTASDRNKDFVSNLCELFSNLTTMDRERTEKLLENIQNYFYETRDGDDVHKCFMVILSAINVVTKGIGNEKLTTDLLSEEEKQFLISQSKNKGFVFDLFYGQMSHSLICKVCNHTIRTNFQLFKSLPLPVEESKSSIGLEKCIKSFFKCSDVNIEEAMSCKCPDKTENIISKSQITHSPKYLLIYLTRGSYFKKGLKNRTFVKCEETIEIPTFHDKISYRLISVIEHIGDNEGGHYYCKNNYEEDNWWLISDEQVTNLGCGFSDIISEKAIAFMFKKL